MINVNIAGLTRVGQLTMAAMKKNKNGLFVIFSSETGLNPSPLLSVYSGSKSYAATFARTLAGEACKGVHVIGAVPFWVASEMTMTSRTSWRMAPPRAFVERLLAGNFSDVLINPWWSHKLFGMLLGSRFGVNIHRSGMLVMRKKVISKMERIQK